MPNQPLPGSQRIALRLSPAELAKLDAYRRQKGLNDLPQALRALIDPPQEPATIDFDDVLAFLIAAPPLSINDRKRLIAVLREHGYLPKI